MSRKVVKLIFKGPSVDCEPRAYITLEHPIWGHGPILGPVATDCFYLPEFEAGVDQLIRELQDVKKVARRKFKRVHEKEMQRRKAARKTQVS